MDGTAAPRRQGAWPDVRRGMRSAAWRAHLVLLALVLGYAAVSAFRSTPDANIGLGLGLLALGAMGAPWSFVLVGLDRVTVDSWPFVAVAATGAVANLVLHALFWARTARIANRR